MKTAQSMPAPTPKPASSRAQPKGDKRARTRAKLLDAALALTREKGLENTTLQDVAQRVGMTTGAIYGNFKNRDELFMALAKRQWAAIKPKFRAGSSFAEKMHTLADAVIAAIPERRLAAVGALTFRAYALRHEDVRVQFRDAMAASYDAGAAWLQTAVDSDELPMPPEILVRVIHALTEGLIFQRILTPELISDKVIHAAFATLAPERRTKDTESLIRHA
jgi:AcrR family transcriptional regulator